jgi:hypothetical protein
MEQEKTDAVISTFCQIALYSPVLRNGSDDQLGRSTFDFLATPGRSESRF